MKVICKPQKLFEKVRIKKLISMKKLYLFFLCCVLSIILSECSDSSSSDNLEVYPLTWMEEQIAQKWYRYHSYDDSREYYIFKDDRTACYFEISSSGSRRNNKCYVHWKLDEENPVDDNVYSIILTTSSGGTLSGDEYHYIEDRIWRGGYSTLAMRPSTTSRDCDCD